MILLDNDRLEFRFPEVHEDACFSLTFQRTLRIPDDGDDYPLPPGLGRFPLRHLDDYAARLPETHAKRGGAIMPMRQAEAMWIDFDSDDYPFAVKVAAGKICAITGEEWTGHLNRDPQDYLALPDQPWLDGYCVGKGTIRQFVAMPLGEGYTAEEQITGAARHGGVQIVVYPMKAERYEKLSARRYARAPAPMMSPAIHHCKTLSMGLAPGGRMRQKIHKDRRSLSAWDQRNRARCFVTLANSAQWAAITGEAPPETPVTAKRYTQAGLPWFDHYDRDAKAAPGGSALSGLASVAQTAQQQGAPLPDNEPLDSIWTIPLGRRRGKEVREPAPGDGAGW